MMMYVCRDLRTLILVVLMQYSASQFLDGVVLQMEQPQTIFARHGRVIFARRTVAGDGEEMLNALIRNLARGWTIPANPCV
jgi:hypothetical protein